MKNEAWFAATINLNHPDPCCGEIDYIIENISIIDKEYIVNNNFAFGGVVSLLLFRRVAV